MQLAGEHHPSGSEAAVAFGGGIFGFDQADATRKLVGNAIQVSSRKKASSYRTVRFDEDHVLVDATDIIQSVRE